MDKLDPGFIQRQLRAEAAAAEKLKFETFDSWQILIK